MADRDIIAIVHGITSRVVLDTNTLIGAILKPQSIPAQALNLATEHAEILVSEETLAELARVIRRDYLDR